MINGKYYYECPKTEQSPNATKPLLDLNKKPELVAQVQNTPAPTRAVEYNATMKQPQSANVVSKSLPRGNRQVPVLERNENDSPRGAVDPAIFGNFVYGGVKLGRTNFTDTDNLDGSATGYGVMLGTNVTEFIGIAISYFYQKTSVFLGLEDRSGGAVITPFTRNRNSGFSNDPTRTNPPLYNKDSYLYAHTITAEAQLHLTNTKQKFRPFIELGVGYKVSGLQEDFPAGTVGGALSSVSQNAFGLVAGIGAKYVLSNSIQVAADFRFFIPVTTGSPEWSSQPLPPRTTGPGANTRRNRNSYRTDQERRNTEYYQQARTNLFHNPDTKLTESPLSQIGLAVQYLF